MRSQFKKSSQSSLKYFHPQNTHQKISFSQYDEEPTILFLASNRESFRGRNCQRNAQSSQRFTKNEGIQKIRAKLTTYQSNLMQSSPQRSQNSVSDGEFVCNYLTPIKKQQFHRLLFKDQINQSPVSQARLQTQQHQNEKVIKKNLVNKYASPKNYQKNFTNAKSCKMVESFFPYQTFHNIQEAKSLKNSLQNISKYCNCQFNQGTKNQNTGIFIDSSSQINFLKLNNQNLFSKLQAQIKRSNQFKQKILTLQKQNRNLLSDNTQKDLKIIQLKQLLKKYQEQRKKILAKELEQFKFVKEVLIQKKRSKSKSKCKQYKKQISKRSDICLSQQKMLMQTIKQQNLINWSQVDPLNQQNMDSKQTSFINFTSRNRAHTINSQLNNQTFILDKQRKTSFQNKSKSRKQGKQNQNLERFLKDKLQIMISNEKKTQKTGKLSNIQVNSEKKNEVILNRKRANTLNSKRM